MSHVQSSDPVAITGIGPLCQDALNMDELISAAQHPQPADHANPIRLFSRFNPSEFFGKRGFKYWTPATRYALAATQLALTDAGLMDVAYAAEEKGVILGTNFAVHEILESLDGTILSEGAEAIQPMEAPNFSVNIPASYVSMKHQCLAFNLTLTNALVAGLESVILASRSILKGRATLVLAGASEGRPDQRAIDLLGGVAAEGAACMFALERLSAAQARDARSYALIGASSSSFIPVYLQEDPAQRALLKKKFYQQLEKILVPAGGPIAITLLEANFPLCQIVNQWVLDYLEEHAIPRRHDLPLMATAVEGCVAPLLQLAAAAGNNGEGMILVTSPHGHVSMLRLEPVGSSKQKQGFDREA